MNAAERLAELEAIGRVCDSGWVSTGLYHLNIRPVDDGGWECDDQDGFFTGRGDAPMEAYLDYLRLMLEGQKIHIRNAEVRMVEIQKEITRIENEMAT